MEKKRKQYSTQLKLKCIMERESGRTFTQIGRENGVHYTTVMKWCQAGKDKILKERYYGGEQEIAVALEDAMPRKVNVEDLKNANKALKEKSTVHSQQSTADYSL